MSAGLAITGSQRSVGVAAGRGPGEPACLDRVEPPRDRDWLWPSIDEVCRQAGVAPGDLTWVAVDVGPGGFSGLRTTIAAAQSIATVLRVPCVAVPGALVAAWSTWPAEGPVAVHTLLSAKGSTAWCATLERDAQGWLQRRAELIEWPAWNAEPGTTILGDDHCPPELVAKCRAAGHALVAPTWTAAGVWAAAKRLLAQGGTCSAAQLAPEYAREPEAATLWRRRHGG